MIIRDETGEDIEGIRRVVTAAFRQPDEANLVDRLRQDGAAVLSLVALAEAEIVGHVMLSSLQAPFPALGLAPLAVRPDRQRSGIGSALVRDAIRRCETGDWAAVFVLGAPPFYGRFGFDAGRAAGFRSAYAGPHFMVLPLAGQLPTLHGAIGYPSAFAGL